MCSDAFTPFGENVSLQLEMDTYFTKFHGLHYYTQHRPSEKERDGMGQNEINLKGANENINRMN